MIARPRQHVCGILSLLMFVFGCEQPQVHSITLSVSERSPSTATTDLAAVLKRCVDKHGFIDADKYGDVAQTLERQLQTLAVTGPRATPKHYTTPNQKLAYWYNARTAWSIALAMRIYKKDKTTEAASLTQYRFPLDGGSMGLPAMDEAIFMLGGYRAVVAAPAADLQRAALPETPFAPETIRKRIQTRFVDFVDDRLRFNVDIETQHVRFPPVLWRYRKEIIAENAHRYGTPEATFLTALLPMVQGSAHRRLQDAVGYTCVLDTSPSELAVTK